MHERQGLDARPENPTNPALFGDETEAQSKTPGQVAGDDTLPGLVPSITVPVGGIEEKELFELLGLRSMQVYPMLGQVLEFPHDVRYQSRPLYAAHYFTADGIRKLIEHFRLRFQVYDGAAPASTGNNSPVYWWQKEALQ